MYNCVTYNYDYDYDYNYNSCLMILIHDSWSCNPVTKYLSNMI